VLAAGDGEEGLAMAAAERPDLVLMDLGLPVLDGWEVTRPLKADPFRTRLPWRPGAARGAVTGSRGAAPWT
jgi:CheY-like chemotaxis protein